MKDFINVFFSTKTTQTKITSANVKPKEMLFGYFVGPFCAFISNAVLGSYLNRYYSDIIGWTDTSKFGLFSALLPVFSVILVIAGNLFAGRLIDNTRTNQGKSRPYMFFSAPLIVIALNILVWTPRESAPFLQMLWIAISYNLYYAAAYPIFYTAHSSMVGLSTRNSKQRGILATFSNAAGVAAVGIGASIVVPILLQSFLFETKNGVIDAVASYNNWRIFMIILCIITFAGIMLEYYFTRERVTEENLKLNIKEKHLSTKLQMKACVTNSYWWIIILYFLLFQFGGLVKNGSMSYYCRWMFNGIQTEAAAGAAMGVLGLIGGIPTAIGMFLAWPIADKLGKQRAVTLGLAISVVGGLISFIDVHNFIIVCAGVILKGIGSIPAMYVTLALLSDVLDHLEAKNGFRSDGFTMSVYGAIMVGLTGLGSGIINALLSAGGYDPSLIAQNNAVQHTLVLCYLGIELICYAVLVVLMLFLKVEKHIKEDHAIILESQKQSVIEAGGTWIEPAVRMQQEQEESEKLAESARIEELRIYCKRKGLDFQKQEQLYQQKIADKKIRQEKIKKLFK